jgi:Cu2+-containing amine oxidase
MAATHIPRVEDFPVMPSETVGFTLKVYTYLYYIYLYIYIYTTVYL